MPDAELIRLAGEHKLRENLHGPGRRGCSPTRGRRSSSATSSASGSRPATSSTVLINAPAVIARDEPPDPEAEQRRARFRELIRKPPDELTDAEKKELQAARGVVRPVVPPLPRVRADRRPAAGHAARDRDALRARRPRATGACWSCSTATTPSSTSGWRSTTGSRASRATRCAGWTCPPGSPRGGVLTQGTVLAVTSNPDRTSPVKRGLFILDNILGSPPAPPPPNIPVAGGGRQEGRRPDPDPAGVDGPAPQPADRAPRATPGWTRWGWPWRTSTRLGRWRDKERAEPDRRLRQADHRASRSRTSAS